MIWNMYSQNMNANNQKNNRSYGKKCIRRVWSLICVGILIVSMLCGCSISGSENTGEKSNNSNEKLRIVTTIFPQYDFVRQIAGDNVSLTMLLKPGEETHSYEPTPQDIIAIQKADLFIYVGGENDEWVEDILESPEMEHVKCLRLVDCVGSVLEEEHVEGMQEERGHHHEDGEHEHSDDEEEQEHSEVHDEEETHSHETEETHALHSAGETEEEHNAHVHTMDEHVWTSPSNAIDIVTHITGELCSLDSEHAQIYKENAQNYEAQLKELDEEFRNVVDEAEHHTILFGDRFPFRYFAAEYGLDYYAAFSGCASDTEPSAATMAFLINKVKEEHIPVVLKMELSNDNIANAIAEACNVPVRVFYSSHNISAEQFETGVTYLDLMKENVETLKEALR